MFSIPKKAPTFPNKHLSFKPNQHAYLNLCYSAAFKTRYERMENKLCNDPAGRERQK